MAWPRKPNQNRPDKSEGPGDWEKREKRRGERRRREWGNRGTKLQTPPHPPSPRRENETMSSKRPDRGEWRRRQKRNRRGMRRKKSEK